MVLAWYNKYINKGIGLDGLQWFFLFPLVVSLSVVCFWLRWLLSEQPPSTSYSLHAPHNSAREVHITPYSKLLYKELLISSTLLKHVFLSFMYHWKNVNKQKKQTKINNAGRLSALWSFVNISVLFLPLCSLPLSSSSCFQHWQQCNLNRFSLGPNRLLPARRICSYWLVIRP